MKTLSPQHISILAGTALALTLGSLSSAQAATCGQILNDFTCTPGINDPVSSSAPGATVTVQDMAEVVSNDENATPIALTGGGTEITNNGRITQQDNGGYAIEGEGGGLRIINNGAIEGADRGIRMTNGFSLNVTNMANGTITSRRQAIRSLEGVTFALVRNAGLIASEEGRALQLRGNGARVLNVGTITGGEEVIEARGDFGLTNSGTIKLNDPSIADEDAVQFSSGNVTNSGLIEGSDDGIDLDEGLIDNRSGGIIRTTGAGNGIDIDEIYDDGIITRQNAFVTVNNAGAIEGARAIGADVAATNSIIIRNEGTLRGTSGTAVDLAPGQGQSSLELSGLNRIFGDVNFGDNDDFLFVSEILTGSLISGGIFNGNGGTDTAIFSQTQYDLMDISSFDVIGDTVNLSLDTGRGIAFATFKSFESWFVGGTQYTTAALSAAINPSAVPLPAGLPLLLAGLGGLALMRRKREA